MSIDQYQAKKHYQSTTVADDYDDYRFRGIRGRMVHKAEQRILNQTLANYFTPKSRVLDLPCGTGRLLEAYQPGGFQVVGCDISDAMLKHARTRFRGDPLFDFQLANAEELPFETNSFDYVVSFRFVLHLPKEVRPKVLSEMIRVAQHRLAINFYFDHPTPVLLLNKLLRRKASLPPNRIAERRLAEEFEGLDVDICGVHKLAWFDPNWAMVVLQKN
jgi:ubiquinone/menaquinone biosynthesis C-methylase UbiE